jgi:hypothetical protein
MTVSSVVQTVLVHKWKQAAYLPQNDEKNLVGGKFKDNVDKDISYP